MAWIGRLPGNRHKFWAQRAITFDMGEDIVIIKENINNSILYCIKDKRGQTLQKDGKWYPWLQIYDYPVPKDIVKITRYNKIEDAFSLLIRWRKTINK